MQGTTQEDFKVYGKPVIHPDLPFDSETESTQRRLEAEEHNETIESALSYFGN